MYISTDFVCLVVTGHFNIHADDSNDHISDVSVIDPSLSDQFYAFFYVSFIHTNQIKYC